MRWLMWAGRWRRVGSELVSCSEEGCRPLLVSQCTTLTQLALLHSRALHLKRMDLPFSPHAMLDSHSR